MAITGTYADRRTRLGTSPQRAGGAAPAAVEIRGVTKAYGPVSALDGVSLSIEKGEFFSLLGPSGCGKTTLLRIIGGFEVQSSGSVLIGGTDASQLPPYARDTNMIFQHLALFPHMNVFENVAFGLRRRRVPGPEIRERVNSALGLVRLEGYDRRSVDQLSGGQRQRVAMARAIVNRPSVLLLDEPLGALDLQLRLQMQEELCRLHRSLGTTFVFVTHDQGEAMTMSDRIAVMAGGRIQQIGTPEEIYEGPRTRFVAAFIGHTNLLDGVVAEMRASRECVVDCGGMRLPAIAAESFEVGRRVTLALRYEKVGLAIPGAHSVSLRGQVTGRTYMGSAVRIAAQIAGGPALTADIAEVERARDLRVGDEVDLTFSARAAVAVAE